MLPEHKFSTVVGSREITFATGKLAEQAGGAVTIQFGDCMLFATATMSSRAREGLDFFPLSVDYEERLYAAGRIPGSFFRREGKATTAAVLVSRLTDRPLRPLFPKNMRNEVQVIIHTLASDGALMLDINSVNVASAALMISNIPWGGPVGAVRVGMINDELVINPTIEEMAESRLDLRLAGTREAIIMVECRADEIPESTIVDALEFGHQGLQPIVDLQFEMQAAVGKEKDEPILAQKNEEYQAKVVEQIGERVAQIVVEHTDRHDRGKAISELRDLLTEELTAADPETEVDVSAIGEATQSVVKKAIRSRILDDKIRPDGRAFNEIRALSSEVGVAPRVHGSGLFRRGETQVMSIASLGTLREAQKLDGLEAADTKRFMHHYNFPPFSTGETWPLRGPKRREIGHGELARAAILPVIPSEDDFPYAIRVVSEVLSSNGSTSQGSVCASVLALMDCGVPIKRPVAGIAMGLVTDEESGKYAILTDIQGMEDHLGDMDFKVAGTTEGVTALQMDIKIMGLSKEVMEEALEQAYQARLMILDSMLETISEPREELNEYAPRLHSMKVNPDKIGAIIGKGGSTIRSLEEVYGVSVDIQDDGTVFVAGVNKEKTDGAIRQIETLTKEVEAGEVYTGKVVRITDFGLFVELVPGIDGMVHISQLSTERVNRIEDVLQVGDEVMVMVTAVSPDGKIRLSRKAILEGWTLEEAIAADNPSSGKRRGKDNNRRGGDRDRHRGNRKR